VVYLWREWVNPARFIIFLLLLFCSFLIIQRRFWSHNDTTVCILFSTALMERESVDILLGLGQRRRATAGFGAPTVSFSGLGGGCVRS
jgi:hypothetical protein